MKTYWTKKYLYIFKLVNPSHFPQGRKDNIFFILVFIQPSIKYALLSNHFQKRFFVGFFFYLFCFRILGYIISKLCVKIKKHLLTMEEHLQYGAAINKSDTRQHVKRADFSPSTSHDPRP